MPVVLRFVFITKAQPKSRDHNHFFLENWENKLELEVALTNYT